MSAKEFRKIPYTKPSITELEVQYATDAAANGWGEHCYDYIVRFEEAFKAHLNVKYAIATSSCTGAPHGHACPGVGPGDEVIVADTNDRYRRTDRASGRHAGFCGHPPGQLVPGSGTSGSRDHAQDQSDRGGASLWKPLRYGCFAGDRRAPRHPRD